MDLASLRSEAKRVHDDAVGYLYDTQRPDGAWTDRLSSSAMATAIAAIALAYDGDGGVGSGGSGSSDGSPDRSGSPCGHPDQVALARRWLREHQRADGGWGLADADPPSDGSVTAFVIAALTVLGDNDSCLDAAQSYLDSVGGEAAILPVDRTWRELVAIVYAMVGLRDVNRQPVQPIEAMLLPARWRNRASIALPGVIGLGVWQSRALRLSPLARLARRFAEPAGLAWLRETQGPNGGIEECPLMAGLVFLGLRLAGAEIGADIQRGCIDYLLTTQRDDGSWAIDRDLEIAVTGYAVHALAESEDVAAQDRLRTTARWLRAAQWQRPFTPLGMPAGGWSWANPTGWPESEDTAVVLSTLGLLGASSSDQEIQAGLRWLLGRQNKDGSWSEWMLNSSMVHDGPCPGVTAHVLLALREFDVDGSHEGAIRRGLAYFEREQDDDGGFSSLWFRDRTHGTAKVLETYAAFGEDSPVAKRARQWLLDNQREDGAWPLTVDYGPPDGGTVEETAWAVYSLLLAGEPADADCVTSAIEYLVARHTESTWRPSAVGMYYDQLNYSDDLIAHTYALRAIGRWLRCAPPG